MSNYAIITNNLTKKYGEQLAVNHVNMHIPTGSIYGFVGENGSGKTTIMRLLMGLARPTEGGYQLFDVDNKDQAINKVRSKISAIVEAPSLVPTMNALDNLKYAAMYYGAKISDDEIKNIIKRVGLEDTGKKIVKNFSLGMRQRLGIAVLLLNKPSLLLLDEPLNGLDPSGISEVRDLIISLNREGITIFISSHILSELEKVATHWGFISHGKILLEISEDELLNQCKKHIEIKYHDINKLIDALKKLDISDYKLTSNESISIYQQTNLVDLLISLRKYDIEIEHVKTSDVDIENYYLSLIKGGN